MKKELQNFSHCFLATQSRSKRTNKKEGLKPGKEVGVDHHGS